jgi:hypothetical protein
MDDGQQAGPNALHFHHDIAPPSRKELSEQDWEDKKSIIRSLYIESEFSLSKVASFMTQNHGFRAR